MPDTVIDIAQQRGVGADEVRKALKAIGAASEMRVTPEEKLRLDAYWKRMEESSARDERAAHHAAPAPAKRTEVVGGVTVRRKRRRREIAADSVSAADAVRLTQTEIPAPAAPVVVKSAGGVAAPASTPSTLSPATPAPPPAAAPAETTPPAASAPSAAAQISPAPAKTPAPPPPVIPVSSQTAQARSAANAEMEAIFNAQRSAEEEKKKAAAEKAAAPPPAPEPAPAPSRPARAPRAAPSLEDDEDEQLARRGAAARRRKRGTLDVGRDAVIKHDKKRRRLRAKGEDSQLTRHGFTEPVGAVVREVEVPESIAITALAQKMAVKASAVVRKLFEMGEQVNVNQTIDFDTASLVVEALGHKPLEARVEDEDDLRPDEGAPEKIETALRAPVVTVMGHVDHGKTSLLDYIRKTRVADGESGGITQHIGAYQVKTAKGAATFIDTPGHELFTAMRARGAKATDIVALVVAADDGVKPQTVEAINHARVAQAPIVVVLNKIDKPDADIEKTRRELSEAGVVPEEWGGSDLMVKVSAKTGEGVEEFLELVALQAEVLELNAPVNTPARGVVIEAQVAHGRGPVATVLVQSGVLRKGDSALCGGEWGRVRAMWDAAGRAVAEASPSAPVEIQGLSGLPEAGDELAVAASEKRARELAEKRRERRRASRMGELDRRRAAAMKEMLDAEEGGGAPGKTLNVIVKSDVAGSREAVIRALEQISGEDARAAVIHSGVGAVSENDINLAQAGGAVVLAFNVRPDSAARKLAKSRGVEILQHKVVYEAADAFRLRLRDLLTPVEEEEVIGTAEVKQIFPIAKTGTIAGCLVTEGALRNDAVLRLVRDGGVVFESGVASLRRFKDEVGEVRAGSECGVRMQRFNDIKPGDVFEVVRKTARAPALASDAAQARESEAV